MDICFEYEGKQYRVTRENGPVTFAARVGQRGRPRKFDTELVQSLVNSSASQRSPENLEVENTEVENPEVENTETEVSVDMDFDLPDEEVDFVVLD